MRKLCPCLIVLLALVNFSVCFEQKESPNSRGELRLKGSAYLSISESDNAGHLSEICESCGCSSSADSITEGFKLYTCLDCNSTKLQQEDCAFKGVVSESSKGNWTKLVSGLETSIYGDYRSLFVGRSNFLANRNNINNLLTRIFEPEFTWERLSHGSIRDNCMVYNNRTQDSDHFKLSYIYTVHGGNNCTDILIHFVDKYSGSTLYKNLRPFKGADGKSSPNSMVVFRHNDIEVEVHSFEKTNLHQEFNITFYDLPPKHLFSNEQQEWVPAGAQSPQMEINPKIIHERRLLLFQLVNSQKSSIPPDCRLENIKVNVVVQCKSVAFQPDPKYSKKFVEEKLESIRSKRSSKNFNLFLEKLEEKLVSALASIPNAQLAPTVAESKLATPLSSLSIPCKEALYLGDIPRLMSAFNYTSILSSYARPNSYITSVHILEDSEDNLLLNNIENALN